ncbi:MAG: hypothetical protein LAT62_11300 [Natronospirillum sp.]|uniref:hypothetical protein n=1 Tax=Natronospirillum sp. TaxID=2812955 RepID=UPI0025EA388A|nr:hypothetical protein [Natronospirillum sp.]MCH8552516.1 hypothetical protein [Natronospirillum sp.]
MITFVTDIRPGESPILTDSNRYWDLVITDLAGVDGSFRIPAPPSGWTHDVLESHAHAGPVTQDGLNAYLVPQAQSLSERHCFVGSTEV